MIHVLSGKGITNVAGVIRVSYPANSTLVVKGTSSGKQFAKDTNTTSSAKAYIFLAPIGNASYTLTATNSAGKTVSKQVYVSKDQVQSVTLMYELVLFDDTDNTSATGGWTFGEWASGGSEFSDATISNNQIVYSQSSYGGIFTKKQIDVTDYKTLHCECTITGYLEYANSFGISKSTNQAIVDSGMDMNSKFVAKKVLAAGTYTGNNALSVDISKITGNCSLGFGVFCSLTLTIKINKVWLV